MRGATALVLLCAVVGCGDDSGSTQDLAAVADVSAFRDLTTRTCGGILACIAACGGDLACQQSCHQQGSTPAKEKYQVLLNCLLTVCGPGDGGSGQCNGATDSAAACLACLADAVTQARSPGGRCYAEYLDCSSN
jgi:hypothetical protein